MARKTVLDAVRIAARRLFRAPALDRTLSSAGEAFFQFSKFLINSVLQCFQTVFRMFQTDLPQGSISMEVAHRESIRIPLTIKPHVPQEKRVYYF